MSEIRDRSRGSTCHLFILQQCRLHRVAGLDYEREDDCACDNCGLEFEVCRPWPIASANCPTMLLHLISCVDCHCGTLQICTRSASQFECDVSIPFLFCWDFSVFLTQYFNPIFDHSRSKRFKLWLQITWFQEQECNLFRYCIPSKKKKEGSRWVRDHMHKGAHKQGGQNSSQIKNWTETL